MIPYKSLLTLDPALSQPLYLQVATQLIHHIQKGTLPPSSRLISSRQLATLLGIHRKTVVTAYDELIAQGWIVSRSTSGTFVAATLPERRPRSLRPDTSTPNPLVVAGYPIIIPEGLNRPFTQLKAGLRLDDGFPDARLAPLIELARAYRTQLLRREANVRLGYSDTWGSLRLRTQLARYLNESRQLRLTTDNIMLVRGSVMGFYLSCLALLRPNDRLVLGETHWPTAQLIGRQANAKLVYIPVDEHGLCVDALESYLKKHVVRMVYVTPHHHYPTTVSLSIERRLALLALSERYQFAILEDDYDYDFHYQRKPLLPLLSADQSGTVLYTGSFSKTISPAFRLGYIAGPTNVLHLLTQYRRIIDRQGDSVLENAVAELFEFGIIERHLRKSLREYKQRRDHFCGLLQQLGDCLQFDIPNGGLAVWTQFAPEFNWVQLSDLARSKGLAVGNGTQFDSPKHIYNATRLGFASSTLPELDQSVDILRQIITSIKTNGTIQ